MNIYGKQTKSGIESSKHLEEVLPRTSHQEDKQKLPTNQAVRMMSVEYMYPKL